MGDALTHLHGSGQTLRWIWDFIIIGLCLYELIIKKKNGIILGLFIFAAGDIINATYSVLDALTILYPVALIPNRLLIIGLGTWISDIGWVLILYALWIAHDNTGQARNKSSKNKP